MKLAAQSTWSIVPSIIVLGLMETMALAQNCPDMRGRWDIESVDGHPTSDLTPLVITQQGCTVHGSFDSTANPRTAHVVDGTANGSVTITRTAPGGCITIMNAALSRDGNRLNMNFSSTNGTCNVPASFPQKRVWHLAAGPVPPRPDTFGKAGTYSGPEGWSHGMDSTMHCGNSPESWVRASADLDRASGLISMTIQLETDDTTRGPKGKVKVVIKDANENNLAVLESAEIGTGGKPPGSAARRDFKSHASIPPAVARRARSMLIEARCTGSSFVIFNINLSTVQDAFTIATLFIAAL